MGVPMLSHARHKWEIFKNFGLLCLLTEENFYALFKMRFLFIILFNFNKVVFA